MKKALPFSVVLLFLAMGLFAQTVSLDTAIGEAGKKIETDLSEGVLAVVVNIESPSEALSDYIAGELTGVLINGKKIRMVDQENIHNIEDELDFQFSGAVSEKTIQAAGKQLNADFVISGEFSEIAGNYRFRVHAVDVSSAIIVSTAIFTVQNSPQITALIAPDSNGVRPGRRPGEGARGQYRIGSYGPGGGIVFYDKGTEAGGWRYLEVAPVETETTCSWGSGVTGVQTSGGIGLGRRNTQYLAHAMKEKKLSKTAVLYCVELNHGGFNDWFLPSVAELEQIYKNLKTKGIGAFADGIYWSSHAGGLNMCGSFNFATGKPMENHAADTARVRAVRAFK